jgi:hypothetical protein
MPKQKPINLDEARRTGRLRVFITAHDIKPDPEVKDPKDRFERLLGAMAKGSAKDDQT